MRPLGYGLPTLLLALLLGACSQNTGGKIGEPPQPPAPPPAVEKTDAGQLPPGHPPINASPQDMAGGMQITPPPAGSGTGDNSLVWDIPPGWVSEVPANPVRRAQLRVPGPGGEGECVVSYFGPGQGGDPMANAERWASQFVQEDGSPAGPTMKTSTIKVGPISVLLVEVKGTFLSGSGMGMPGVQEKPGSMLLGAVAEGPDANWFFKFTGPEKTIEAQRGAFDKMVRSLRQGA